VHLGSVLAEESPPGQEAKRMQFPTEPPQLESQQHVRVGQLYLGSASPGQPEATGSSPLRCGRIKTDTYINLCSTTHNTPLFINS